MMKISQKMKLTIVSLVVLVFCGGFYFYQQSNSTDGLTDKGTSPFAPEENGFKTKRDTAQNTTETKKPGVIKVDVKGAVKRPGVFTAKEGERVIDLITKAGNLTANADKNKVNLAQLVEDQMVIYVPEIGEEIEGVPGEGAAGAIASKSGAGEKVNLNSASQSDLETLPGIGPSKAAAILEYREKNGPFKAIEDMKNITGIGDKTFEKLIDSITVK